MEYKMADSLLTAKEDDSTPRVETIGQEYLYSNYNSIFKTSCDEGLLNDAWIRKYATFVKRYSEEQPLYGITHRIATTYNPNTSSCDDTTNHLSSPSVDIGLSKPNPNQLTVNLQKTSTEGVTPNNKVFIVHGHDNAAKNETREMLELLGFETIILQEQPGASITIIEKLEKYSDVGFAVILYTECDVGRKKEPLKNLKNTVQGKMLYLNTEILSGN